MSKSILQTAITNKNLHLELTYRLLATLPESGSFNDEPTIDTAPTLGHDAELSSEFACLLSMMAEENGELS